MITAQASTKRKPRTVADGAASSLSAYNLAGAALALLAALYFWPSWERDKLPPLLAAIRSNACYLQAVAKQLATGGPFNRDIIRTKQKAERAGNIATASFHRMTAAPLSRQEDAEHAAALVDSNQRFTGAISVITSHLKTSSAAIDPAITQVLDSLVTALKASSNAVEIGTPSADLILQSLPPHLLTPAIETLAAEVLALTAKDSEASVVPPRPYDVGCVGVR